MGEEGQRTGAPGNARRGSGIASPFWACFFPILGLFPPQETGDGSVCRFPSSIRPSKGQSPSAALCFWPQLNTRTRGVGASPTTRPSDGVQAGSRAPPHSPAEQEAPPGRARNPSGSPPPSPEPQPRQLPVRQRFEKPASGWSRRGHQPPGRTKSRPQGDRALGPPSWRAHAQWVRPAPLASLRGVFRDPSSGYRLGCGERLAHLRR